MFKKRITPFACVIISLLVCTVTFVSVYSYSEIKHKKELNSIRLDSADMGEYADFIGLAGDEEEKYTKLAQMIAMIEGYYVHDYDKSELWENLYKSLVVSIADDYGQYLTAEEYASLIDSSDGDFVGIGVHATYDVDTEGVYIFGVIPNSPAEKAGIKKGDIIVAAEGIEASDETYYELLDSVRGEAGTEVSVTVLRGDERKELKITRQAVASENVFYEKLENNIAYIRILSFSDETVSEEFTKKLALAQSEGCESFIFDVRNNAGGYLNEICAVLDLLLPEGPIINIVDKNGNTQTQNSDANCIKGKMTVLCNGNTASAAELFTAALRDYELAEIIGTKTFGKGTMQTTRVLVDGSTLKLSSAFYNPPSNISYDKIGIKPDHEIALPEEWENRFFKMPKEEDIQLQMAIEILNATK